MMHFRNSNLPKDVIITIFEYNPEHREKMKDVLDELYKLNMVHCDNESVFMVIIIMIYLTKIQDVKKVYLNGVETEFIILNHIFVVKIVRLTKCGVAIMT